MIIQSSDKALLRIYECGACRKTFAEQFDHASAAHVQALAYRNHRHQAGSCCHLGEIEVSEAVLMELTLLIEKNERTK